MYTGTNPSALRSREWIHDALLQLLSQEKYNQITIKDICQKADLSRQTFYQIFDSKEEVMEYHFMLLFQQFTAECDSFHDIGLEQIVYHFFLFFYNQRAFVQVLIANNLTHLLEQQFEVYLRQIENFQRISEKDGNPDYAAAYMAGALTQILIHWFNQSFDLSINELSKVTESILTGRALANPKDTWQNTEGKNS